MDHDVDDNSETPHRKTVNARDGLIDFSSYSTAQLRELQDSLDPEEFSENHRRIIDALTRRGAAAFLAPGGSVVGRFTPGTGLPGWLSAKVGRSPLYGGGYIDIRASQIILGGTQRTWLGVGVPTELTRELENVRNVVADGPTVRFGIRRRFGPAEQIHFQPDSLDQTKAIVDRLPQSKSANFLENWSALREFNRRLQEIGRRPWVTPIIVALNFIVFLTMVATTRRAGGFVPQEFLVWGANFGPLTVNGEWWRLFTAMFVHVSLLHVSLNMWAFWNIGRLSEWLFGRTTLLFLYVAAGILGGLTSIAWNPSLSSVGASGAVFGIFGAFLAFLSRQRHQIPPVILRRHWISTAAFILFNLITSAIQPGIDNAAHVGGHLAGFLLGFVMARPLDREHRERLPVGRSLVATTIIAIALLAAAWQIRGIGSQIAIPEQYFRQHSAYVHGEMENLQLWNTLVQSASAGSLSNAELGERFEREILPFWQTQRDQLAHENKTLTGEQLSYGRMVADFARLRFEWAEAIIQASSDSSADRLNNVRELSNQTLALTARLELIGLRARLDHRRQALAAAPLVTRIRELFGGRWACIGSPPVTGTPTPASDDQRDGPATRHALGCRAQQLFMAGDYATLDALLNRYMHSLGDLRDGSSGFEGLVRGLRDLARFGGLGPEKALEHTSDWRRQVKASPMADLTAVIFLREWAWSARGGGFANSVSSQNMAAYTYRNDMAAAALDEVATRAAKNPLWYELSLEVGLDQGKGKGQLQAIFDSALTIAPDYSPLYDEMPRILMPRWGGSYEDVDRFINGVNTRTEGTRGFEPYALLYTEYARLEGDDVDLFADTKAFWGGMKSGYLSLLSRYPTSDAVLNHFAHVACRAHDKAEYEKLRAALDKRRSSAAWTAKYSIESCDKTLAIAGDTLPPLSIRAQVGTRVRSLGGLRLGMTRTEVLAAKGTPISQGDNYWVYNTIDPAHNGVVTASFSHSDHSSEGEVRAIEYIGDNASAPGELPFLTGMSSVEVLEMYGPQVDGRLTLSGPMTFRFRNGVYVDTRDAKVYRYGIYRSSESEGTPTPFGQLKP